MKYWYMMWRIAPGTVFFSLGCVRTDVYMSLDGTRVLTGLFTHSFPQQGYLAGTSDRQATATPTEAFIPLVIRCASNPHFLARIASSRALAALVLPAQAPGVVSQLLGRLPKNEMEAISAGAGAHNHMHGEQLGLSVVC